MKGYYILACVYSVENLYKLYRIRYHMDIKFEIMYTDYAIGFFSQNLIYGFIYLLLYIDISIWLRNKARNLRPILIC